MTTLPSFESYGNYSSSNYGAHALVFTLPCGGRVWFSYDTPVAFYKDGKSVVRSNRWGPTTGKHLSWIDGGSLLARKHRVTGAEFEVALAKAFAP